MDGPGPEHYRHLPTPQAVASPDTPEAYVAELPVLTLEVFTAMCARPDPSHARLDRLVRLAAAGPELFAQWPPAAAEERRRSRSARRLHAGMMRAVLALPLSAGQLRELAGSGCADPAVARAVCHHPGVDAAAVAAFTVATWTWRRPSPRSDPDGVAAARAALEVVAGSGPAGRAATAAVLAGYCEPALVEAVGAVVAAGPAAAAVFAALAAEQRPGARLPLAELVAAAVALAS